MEKQTNGKERTVDGNLDYFKADTKGVTIDGQWYNAADNVLPFIEKLVGKHVQATIKGANTLTFIAPFEAEQMVEKALEKPASPDVEDPGNVNAPDKQVLIVRQCCIKAASRTLGDDRLITTAKIIEIAEEFEEWVMRR